MILEDMELFGRRKKKRKKKRSNRVLRAKLRTGPGKRRDVRTAVVGFALAVLAAVVTVLGLGIAYAGRQWFSENDMYAIQNLRICGDSDIVSYFIREKKDIREGTNLFSFDVTELRDEFLKQRYAAKYKSMEITRILPDTLEIQVTERVPVARLDGSGGLVSDANGYVFGIQAGRQALPLIIGYPEAPPLPSERIHGNARDAVSLLDLCEQTGLGRSISITAIDVTGGFRGRAADMRLYLYDQVQADIWWPHGEDPSAASSEDLRKRLQVLKRVLDDARKRGKRVQTVNLTLESYTNNCPATYWN